RAGPRARGRRGPDQSHPLRGRAALPPGADPGPGGAGQGQRELGRASACAGRAAQGAGAAGAVAGARAVPRVRHRRDGPRVPVHAACPGLSGAVGGPRRGAGMSGATPMRALLAQFWSGRRDLALITLVVGVLVVLFVPIPPLLLDFLLVVNIS